MLVADDDMRRILQQRDSGGAMSQFMGYDATSEISQLGRWAGARWIGIERARVNHPS